MLREDGVPFTANSSSPSEVSLCEFRFIRSSELLHASMGMSKGMFWIEMLFLDEFLAQSELLFHSESRCRLSSVMAS